MPKHWVPMANGTAGNNSSATHKYGQRSHHTRNTLRVLHAPPLLLQELSSAQRQNAELQGTSAQLTSRLDEESEVVSALRAQLVEYKLQMGQMQLQAKKGRTLATNNSTTMFRRPGTPPGPGQLSFSGAAGAAGQWGSSSMASGDSTAAAAALAAGAAALPAEFVLAPVFGGAGGVAGSSLGRQQHR